MISPHDNLAKLRRQLDETQRTCNALEMRPHEPLRDFEYRVKRHSDKLLSLKVAEKVQQEQVEQEAREAEERLKKKSLTGWLWAITYPELPQRLCFRQRGGARYFIDFLRLAFVLSSRTLF